LHSDQCIARKRYVFIFGQQYRTENKKAVLLLQRNRAMPL